MWGKLTQIKTNHVMPQIIYSGYTADSVEKVFHRHTSNIIIGIVRNKYNMTS